MSDIQITTLSNGPLQVKGPIDLLDPTGKPFDLGGKPAIYLCRCGASKNRPFCDGAHKTAGFQADEKAG